MEYTISPNYSIYSKANDLEPNMSTWTEESSGQGTKRPLLSQPISANDE